MFLHIQPSDSLAIYDQVVRQVKFAVASGAIRPGELVVSVRDLAHDLAINPNTVARAYRQLQDDGVLETVRGTGLAVAKGAASAVANSVWNWSAAASAKRCVKPAKANWMTTNCVNWSTNNFPRS